MSKYKTAIEERMKCCRTCNRHVSSTTTLKWSFYCMAFQKYVNPMNACHWYSPMSGYEEVKGEAE